MICQNETIGESMKRTYTIIMIHDDGYQTTKRRTIVVDIECVAVADKLNERGSSISNFKVQYPAYEGDHFIASMSKYPNSSFINHNEAKAIATEIRKFVTKKG